MEQSSLHLPAAVSLRRLFPDAQFRGGADLVAVDAVEHSADCRPGSVFAVIRGSRVNGAAFVAEALARGACGLLTDHEIAAAPVVQCVVPNVRVAFALLCAELAGRPTERLAVAGVTGTNGKTTVTWMVRSILVQADRRCGVLGTVEYHDGCHSEPSHLTTPDSRALAQWLARMATNGASHAAIELSSHALHQGRAAGAALAAAVVTNITQDHFDYHASFDAYRDSKARILELVRRDGVVVLNRDDPGSWSLRERVAGNDCVTFGLQPAADVTAQILEESRAGARFRLALFGRAHECRIELVGRHNVANCLAAAAVAARLGVADDAIIAGLAAFRCVPGRLERIAVGQPFDVFVDYAHTDDALRRCLTGLRSVTAGRLICIFGAGGERDRSKRPLMGRAALLADVPIVTSDNPRGEDPQQIIDDILAGMESQRGRADVEPDRAAAIRRALVLAQPGDCVLIAGKGHEREQIIGRQKLPFDDRAVARALLWELLAGRPHDARRTA